MKAVTFHKYGKPDVLQYKEVDKPTPRPNEILIKTHAATVTAGDCELRRFQVHGLFWLPLRIYMGITGPRNPILGLEIAGEIEAVGKSVTKFSPGEQVVASSGLKFGGYAEYVCLPESYPISHKPSNLSYGEAAGMPIGGLNALHFLRRTQLMPGERILIYGATGSIGMAALQLAKHMGAHVTGLCGTADLELVKSLGADEVVDYMKEDFAAEENVYDVIFDAVGKSNYDASLRALKPHGRYVLANPSVWDMIRGTWTSLTTSQKVQYAFAGESAEDLSQIAELLEDGVIKPVIDRRYALEDVEKAHRYVELGYKTGTVVIDIVQERATN